MHLDGLPDYPTEEQIEALLENHANVRAIWDQTTLYPPEDTSPSGWDQSFASTLAALGFPPERVASYLRAYRAHHSPEKGKQDRADYILRTVERAQPADAHLGEAPEPGGEQDDCPPEDGPPYEAGRSAGAGASNGAGQHQTAGDAQGRNRGTFKTGPAQPKAPGWPEPGELGRLDPAPEFPTRFLPMCLRQWVETQADNMGCPGRPPGDPEPGHDRRLHRAAGHLAPEAARLELARATMRVGRHHRSQRRAQEPVPDACDRSAARRRGAIPRGLERRPRSLGGPPGSQERQGQGQGRQRHRRTIPSRSSPRW